MNAARTTCEPGGAGASTNSPDWLAVADRSGHGPDESGSITTRALASGAVVSVATTWPRMAGCGTPPGQGAGVTLTEWDEMHAARLMAANGKTKEATARVCRRPLEFAQCA